MKISGCAAQYQAIPIRLIILGLVLFLGAARLSRGADADLAQLRKQLAAAEEADDKPATIELSRRIVALAPNDIESWEKILQGLYEAEDYDRLGETLNTWQKATKNPPNAIEAWRGDLDTKRKDYVAAEKHYRAFLSRKPSREDTAEMYEKLADVFVEQQRFVDAEGALTKALAAKDTPNLRVYRATALLRLHKWDAAYAEMEKARKADSTDDQVKEWLPQFELLSEFLPRVKDLDAKIAKKPNDVDLMLDRARLFALANRPLLALDDCERAMKLDPASVRARVQTGEALLDLNRDEDAAKLQVGRNLARGTNKHVEEKPLSELRTEDAKIAKDPNAALPLAERSRTLRSLNQYVLALADAEAGLAIDEDSGPAHFETACNLRALDRTKDALPNAIRATELMADDPSAWYLRGLVEYARADYQAAIESQTHSLQIKETVDALKEREHSLRRIGQNDKADVDLKRIRELDPSMKE